MIYKTGTLFLNDNDVLEKEKENIKMCAYVLTLCYTMLFTLIICCVTISSSMLMIVLLLSSTMYSRKIHLTLNMDAAILIKTKVIEINVQYDGGCT